MALKERIGEAEPASFGLAGLNNLSGLWGIGLSLVVWYLALESEGRWRVASSVRA